MSLLVCTNCGEHHFEAEHTCPHCKKPRLKGLQSRTRRTSIAILLGLALAGCGEKESDTADTATETAEPATETEEQTLYGVAASDADSEA